MKRRGSGILLHITSLPSPSGIGDLGPQAYQFADALARTGQSFWQILPLTPTTPVGGNSPYHGQSAFACNPLLISPELLVQDGLLEAAEISDSLPPSAGPVDYDRVIAYKEKLFGLAFERFQARGKKDDFEDFCSRQGHWLEDYSRFVALHDRFGGRVWSDWPAEVRDRNPGTLQELDRELTGPRDREKFLQFTFSRQWTRLKSYCNERAVQIIGDIPIYVQYDSADLWVHPELFKLDENKKPYVVAGVPPDYFSKTGQLWGNPIYRWDMLRNRNYDWWMDRMERNGILYDLVRIDHFLGLVAFWEVPAQEKTAMNGRWIEAQGEDFLRRLFKKFPSLLVIAEDLGSVTPAVRDLMSRFELPGMKVLLFAFGDNIAHNPYAPHNHVRNCVLYTGTHDNNTVRGWFEQDASPEEKNTFFRYLGREVTSDAISLIFIRLAMMSVAQMTIVPVQDLLGLGAEGRMNVPSSAQGNWKWKLAPGQFTQGHEDLLRELTETYGRA